jgi:septal ring factor EnvC (AmiA/AmiB activator)
MAVDQVIPLLERGKIEADKELTSVVQSISALQSDLQALRTKERRLRALIASIDEAILLLGA